MIREAIYKLTNKKNLNFKESKQVFEEIFDHQAAFSQIAAFLTSLKMKGEVEDEIFAAATVIRERANKLNVKGEAFLCLEDKNQQIMDTCGTGGSGLNKFNISTAVGFVVSSLGVKVAKHGNRAMSSSCGSADVLEAMGINISVPGSVMEEAIKKIGIGFLYAPLYHPALKEVGQIRREIGIRTIFNILGPLCNPAFANYQLLGVYSKDLVPVLARVLKKLGVKRAFVVFGKDLKDEISLTGRTEVSFINNKKITNFSLSPSSFGLKTIKVEEIIVKNKNESARVIKNILKGKSGPTRDIVLANAAACFYLLGKVEDFKKGVKLAAKLIDNGKAKDKFTEFKKFLDKNA